MSEPSEPFEPPNDVSSPAGAIDTDTVSAGEVGEAVAADGPAQDAGLEVVIIGEIPDTSDLARMLWTARCTNPAHGLLGTYENQELAEQARDRHLAERLG